MRCSTCKKSQIGPNTKPYGGYMCVNDHLQCVCCNSKKNGLCGICNEVTNFVRMSYKPRTYPDASVAGTASALPNRTATQVEQETSCYSYSSGQTHSIEAKHSTATVTLIRSQYSVKQDNVLATNCNMNAAAMTVKPASLSTLCNFPDSSDLHQGRNKKNLDAVQRIPLEDHRDSKGINMRKSGRNEETDSIATYTITSLGNEHDGYCTSENESTKTTGPTPDNELSSSDEIAGVKDVNSKQKGQHGKNQGTSTKLKQYSHPVFPNAPQILPYDELSNIYRVCRNAIKNTENQASNYNSVLPPQIEIVQPPPCMMYDLKRNRVPFIRKPIEIRNLCILGTPANCPDTACGSETFLSDFARHFMFDHFNVPVEHIMPRQVQNVLFDPRLPMRGKKTVFKFYLLKEKIIGMARSEDRDLLPLMFMCSRLSLDDIIRASSKKKPTPNPKQLPKQNGTDDEEFILFWICSFAPHKIPVTVTMSVLPHSGTNMKGHVARTTGTDPIERTSKVIDVFHSGKALSLTAAELAYLTNDGKEMLQMQIFFQ